jgi:hypothetical protein
MRHLWSDACAVALTRRQARAASPRLHVVVVSSGLCRQEVARHSLYNNSLPTPTCEVADNNRIHLRGHKIAVTSTMISVTQLYLLFTLILLVGIGKFRNEYSDNYKYMPD